jgi:hypothetical protein
VANPTIAVSSAKSHFDATTFYWPMSGSYLKRYVPNQLVGMGSDGYCTDLDDGASRLFLGLAVGIDGEMDSSTDAARSLLIDRPKHFSFPLQTGTASKATALGKTAYAYDSGKVTLDQSSLTYANIVGRVVDVGDIASVTTLNSTYSVVVEPFPMRSGCGAKTLSATGNQTLNVTDLNKTILVPNTANLTVTLPAIALTTAGDKLTFVRTATANFTVTLDGNASEKINNATTEGSICLKGDSLELTSDGSEWYITGKNKN